MKKLILSSIIISSLFSDVTSITPYLAYINYDKNNSTKNNAKIEGFSYSKGNLKYLLSLDISYMKINNQDGSSEKQNDITISYNKYFKKIFFGFGYHHINTNDTSLGNGDIFIFSLGGYNLKYYLKNYTKYTYGLFTYYSQYKDAYNDYYEKTGVNLLQLSPYFNIFKTINLYLSNNIHFGFDLTKANNYNKTSYQYYTISDTLYYKKHFFSFQIKFGETKTLVDSGGVVVYNSKDLLKDSKKIGYGYFIKPNLIFSINYTTQKGQEDTSLGDYSHKITSASITYSF